jgi:hypothetical protein
VQPSRIEHGARPRPSRLTATARPSLANFLPEARVYRNPVHDDLGVFALDAVRIEGRGNEIVRPRVSGSRSRASLRPVVPESTAFG